MENFFKVLVVLMDKLDGTDFAVLGTYNLYLQGIKISPSDLDLTTDDNGITKISKIFGSLVRVRGSSYKETNFEIDGVEVHVVSSVSNKLRPPFRRDINWLKKDGLRIPCMSLESELSFYKKIRRKKDGRKIELIQERLKK